MATNQHSPILLRLEADLAGWLADAASGAGVSRNELIADWLCLLRELVHEHDAWDEMPDAPPVPLEAIGCVVAESMLSLRGKSRSLHEALRLHNRIQRQLQAEVAKSKADQAAKKAGKVSKR
jgi:hypothetical protein